MPIVFSEVGVCGIVGLQPLVVKKKTLPLQGDLDHVLP